MIRELAALAALTAFSAAPAMAQQRGYSFTGDVGLGAQSKPAYMGSDEQSVGPWLILRDFRLVRPGQTEKTAQGFTIAPTWDYRGGRDADNHDDLKGMDDIGRSIELGAGLHYYAGPVTAYVDLRKGFGGHHGLVGEIGARYRHHVSDRFSLTGLVEGQYGDDEFTRTYFDVSPKEAAKTGYEVYDPSGGFYAVAVGLSGRYELTPNWALLGEARYTRLIGDAADSPIVKEKDEPAIKLGIVRHFDLRF